MAYHPKLSYLNVQHLCTYNLSISLIKKLSEFSSANQIYFLASKSDVFPCQPIICIHLPANQMYSLASRCSQSDVFPCKPIKCFPLQASQKLYTIQIKESVFFSSYHQITGQSVIFLIGCPFISISSQQLIRSLPHKYQPIKIQLFLSMTNQKSSSSLA